MVVVLVVLAGCRIGFDRVTDDAVPRDGAPDDSAPRVTAVVQLLPTRDIWVGVTARVALGTWHTVTDDLATYLPWSTGEPDGTRLERCVETEFPLYNFIDQDCTVGRRFICECDGKGSDPTAYRAL